MEPTTLMNKNAKLETRNVPLVWRFFVPRSWPTWVFNGTNHPHEQERETRNSKRSSRL